MTRFDIIKAIHNTENNNDEEFLSRQEELEEMTDEELWEEAQEVFDLL